MLCSTFIVTHNQTAFLVLHWIGKKELLRSLATRNYNFYALAHMLYWLKMSNWNTKLIRLHGNVSCCPKIRAHKLREYINEINVNLWFWYIHNSVVFYPMDAKVATEVPSDQERQIWRNSRKLFLRYEWANFSGFFFLSFSSSPFHTLGKLL